MIDLIRQVKTEWIITIISVLTALAAILIAYITWRTDKGSIDSKFTEVDNRFVRMEKDLKEHITGSNEMAESNRKENREEHHLLFDRIDEIKNLLIEGKINKRK